MTYSKRASAGPTHRRVLDDEFADSRTENEKLKVRPEFVILVDEPMQHYIIIS
jgi:hypothetical protein